MSRKRTNFSRRDNERFSHDFLNLSHNWKTRSRRRNPSSLVTASRISTTWRFTLEDISKCFNIRPPPVLTIEIFFKHSYYLFSVHRSWISGKRARMKLNEGDTLHLGASSRLYRLNWVILRCAYNLDNPFVPQLDDAGDAVGEETEVTLLDQDKEMLFDRNDEVESLSDNLEGLEQLFL